MSYKLIDLFCGAGGLSLGFEKSGFEIVKAIDFNKNAIETYNKNLNYSCGIVEDLTQLKPEFFENLKPIDGIIGGPPCQGFSTAGRRNPDDIRNKLYKEYFKILENLTPRFFIIENVVGILTYAKGEVVNDIRKRANKLGYIIFEQILDAVDYGVPQHRRRVIFVGIKKEIVFEKGDFHFPSPTCTKYITIEEALSDLPQYIDKNQPDTVYYAQKPQNDYQALMREKSNIVYNHNFTNHSDKTIKTIKLVPEGGSIQDLSDEDKGGRKYHALLRKMKRNEPSLTIDTGHRTYFHFSEPRIPSVREVARLQSFPDDFVFLGPKAEQYKQVGNAVPPLLAYKIANKIREYLED